MPVAEDGERRRRSIPAGAGKPELQLVPPDAHAAVYPRGCGEATRCPRCGRWLAGLSPRVRGSLLANVPCVRSSRGSIPAGAGKPPKPGAKSPLVTVYPRGCGEAALGVRWVAGCIGLSPRVRGSRCHGAIAASDPRGMGLSPRVRGSRPGVRSVATAMTDVCGLSPRVRGSPRFG